MSKTPEEFHAAMEKLPAIGDRVVALVMALAGGPVGIFLAIHDPESGAVVTTTNLDDAEAVTSLVGWLHEQHQTEAYDVEERPSETLQ
jgi:hypothetical protein